MTCHLLALCFDAHDPPRLARFWAGVLGWEMADEPQDGIALLPSDDTGFRIRFLPTQEQKAGQNQMHFDLTSASLEDQQQMVARSLGLGARHIDIGQRPEEGHVVLADPEGNELCVIEPDNTFLADCGSIGALACDGSQAVGYFWSEALGWPLVWDQDQETAIRSPHGGPKITWGGPPLMPTTGKNRLHFDLAPPVDGDQPATVISQRRSTVSFPSGQRASTAVRARLAGWSWPIPMAMSSVFCPRASANRSRVAGPSPLHAAGTAT